jgi:hypothetical protein
MAAASAAHDAHGESAVENGENNCVHDQNRKLEELSTSCSWIFSPFWLVFARFLHTMNHVV